MNYILHLSVRHILLNSLEQTEMKSGFTRQRQTFTVVCPCGYFREVDSEKQRDMIGRMHKKKCNVPKSAASRDKALLQCIKTARQTMSCPQVCKTKFVEQDADNAAQVQIDPHSNTMGIRLQKSEVEQLPELLCYLSKKK